MAALQADLKAHGDLRSVSITVDPLTDSTALLSQYADRYGGRPRTLAVPHRRAEGNIRRIVQQGFRLSAAPVDDNAPDPVVFHSTRFVLVDRNGEIRGYYDSNDPRALETSARERPEPTGREGIAHLPSVIPAKQAVSTRHPSEATAPEIVIPAPLRHSRESGNPGGVEWGNTA